jgi:hypothetical protein
LAEVQPNKVVVGQGYVDLLVTMGEAAVGFDGGRP